MAGYAELAQLLLGSTEGELKRTLAQFDPVQWANDTAKLYLPKAGRLDFTEHAFLLEVYRDTWPEIIALKGAQLGFSTWAIARTLWMALTFPCSIIYTFPTREQVSEYTASRINPIINGSAYIKERILDVDSVRVKQFVRNPIPRGSPIIGVSTVYFNGAQNEKDPTATDADMLVHDEEDRANPQIIEQYGSRLDHSRFKWKIRLSTPTRPGYGVSKGYDESDRRRWLIRCHGCNAEFPMGSDIETWHLNVEPSSYEEVLHGIPSRFKCHLCDTTITNEDRIGGRWVPEKTSDTLPHGYQLSQLAAPWVSAADVLKKRRDATYDADFYNLVLGLPYLSGTNVMSEEAVRRRMFGGREELFGEGYFMGADIGKNIDVVIGKWNGEGKPQTVRIITVKTWAELDEFMFRYAIVSAIVDALPEERDAKSFQERWNAPGMIRVWRCIYRTPSASSAQREILWRDEKETMTPIVSVPRSEILTASSDELMSRRILPDFTGSEWQQRYIEHHRNSKKVPVWVEGQEADRSVADYEWVADGADHYFHAGTYEMMARMAPRGLAPPLERGFRSISGARRSKDPATLERPPAVKIQRWG